MRPVAIVNIILGVLLAAFGLVLLIGARQPAGIIPLIIGATLSYLGLRPGRVALVIFGHGCILVGCMLVAWGIYLLPHTPATFGMVFFRPLFWGLFSILGGVCANYHAFCHCLRSGTG